MSSFTLSPDLWAPQARSVQAVIDATERSNRICLYSPTGSGKTRMAIELFNWAMSHGKGGIFYVNRKLLVGQTLARMQAFQLPCGVRAADYEDQYDFSAPFQVASIDTERSRVSQRNIWQRHDVGRGGVVIVDEAHIQKSDAMWEACQHYKDRGAKVILLTATPIGLSDWADELIVAGRLQEFRECKALVPAVVRSIEQPDLAKVKRNVTGEYVIDGQKRMIYTQSIVGSVLDRWKEYNPDARPTMLYAPGVEESIWFTQNFEKIGVRWAHIDATDAYVDGKKTKLTRTVWDEILARYKDGNIKGLSCRFKLREGIDVPATYHCILATPIGSLASYIQTVGRVLRYSTETPDHVLVTDHGGNYLRHGSPNHDRDWHSWWKLPENVVSNMHENNIREGLTPEPIRCPKCSGERASGAKCPHCGFEHEKSVRQVIQEDGRMVLREGRLLKPKFIKREPNTAELWEKMFWGWRKSKKCADKTFSQLEGYFAYENGYHPPRDMDLMPKNRLDWHRKIRDIPMSDLTGDPTKKTDPRQRRNYPSHGNQAEFF
jgi:DNA repair protein RadD